jgi:hypothetical protein
MACPPKAKHNNPPASSAHNSPASSAFAVPCHLPQSQGVRLPLSTNSKARVQPTQLAETNNPEASSSSTSQLQPSQSKSNPAATIKSRRYVCHHLLHHHSPRNRPSHALATPESPLGAASDRRCKCQRAKKRHSCRPSTPHGSPQGVLNHRLHLPSHWPGRGAGAIPQPSAFKLPPPTSPTELPDFSALMSMPLTARPGARRDSPTFNLQPSPVVLRTSTLHLPAPTDHERYEAARGSNSGFLDPPHCPGRGAGATPPPSTSDLRAPIFDSPPFNSQAPNDHLRNEAARSFNYRLHLP